MFRVLFFLVLAVIFFAPLFVFADTSDQQFILTQLEAQNLLTTVSKKLTQFVKLQFPYLEPEEQLAVSLVRGGIVKKYIEFLPGFVSTETVKLVISTTKVFSEVPQSTIGSIISKLEQYTVDEAIKAGTNWLIENKIYTTSGELSGTYTSHFGGQVSVKFQYVVLYQVKSTKSGHLLIEFYSSDAISPPSDSNIDTLIWEKGDWLRKGDSGIHPFVLRIEGDAEKGGYGWSLDPKTKITVEFPDKVPRLELAKKAPTYFLEEQKINLLNKLTAVKKVFDALGGAGIELFNKLGQGVGMVKNTAESLFDFAAKVISLGGGAGLLNPFTEESQQLDAIET